MASLPGPITGSMPSIPMNCMAKFVLTNLTLIGNCDIPIDTFFSINNLKSINYWQNERFCSSECKRATTRISDDLKSPECRDQYLGTLDGKELATYLNIAMSVSCIKTADDNGYCLHSQGPQLFPIIETKSPTDAVLSILMNNDIICTDCFEKELNEAQSQDLSDLDMPVRAAINVLKFGYRLRCPRLSTVVSLPIPPKVTPTPTVTSISSSISSSTPTSSAMNHLPLLFNALYLFL